MLQNKRLAALLCAVLVLLSVPFGAGAETAVDTEREVSLTIHGQWDGIPLKGAEFGIVRISEVASGGELAVLSEFAQFQELLDIRGENAERWHAAALMLEQHILSENVTYTACAVTSVQGSVTFSEIPQGLYLVLGAHHKQDGYVYSTDPFFVQLPSKDIERHEWCYETAVNAKPDRTEETVSLQIVKQWRDKYHGDSRPEKIRLHLYRDGKKYQDITLPQNGAWYCTLENLPANHSWYVEEIPVPGYDTEVTREGNVFLIRNTLRKNTLDGKLPQTGMLWWPIPWLLILGTGLILAGLILRRSDNEA